MSLRPPASGRRVATGMLRVDAARAIAKLREYQLSEPTAWVLEGIRAAVASGATRVELQGDSNDIWLSWQGEAWPSESLPTLLDELVSPSSAQHGQKFRLLATAVNSALGLRPAYIDVYRIGKEGAEKVRYLASLLEEQDDASVLARPTLEEVPVPSQARGAAMFVHFRRRFGMEPLRNLFQGQPPEMPIARAACGDLPIPIVIGDEEFGAHRNQSDLLRVDIGQDIDGFLALMDPWYAHPSKYAQMHVAEQGVRIASYALDLQNSNLLAPLPIRLFIDAERMPTNASRSEVRRNSHPISTAERQLPAIFESLCQKICAALDPEAATEAARRAPLRNATLSLLGASVAGSGWTTLARNLRNPLRSLAELKLLRNAVGEERALSDGWDGAILYTGKEPLAADLHPWFARTLWVAKGDAASAIAPHKVDGSLLRAELRSAHRELRARRRFQSHATREPTFERVPRHWVHAKLDATMADTCTPPSPRRLEGEICLWPRGQGGRVTVLVDGREIEDVEIPSALPFRAVVAGPRLTPAPDYRSVVRDGHYDAMVSYVLRAAIRCVEALCLDGAEHFSLMAGPSSGEMRTLVQGALETVHQLGLEVGVKSPLVDYAAWELADGGWASLADLREKKAVGCAPSRRNFAAPRGRMTVIGASPSQRKDLRSLLEPDTALVYYDPKRLPFHADSATVLASSFSHTIANVVAMPIREDDCQGAIAWGLHKNDLRLCHRGKHLASYGPSASVPGATIAVDGDKVIPTTNWDGVHDDAGVLTRDYASWQTVLVRAYAMALIGRAPREFIKTGQSMTLNEGPGRNFVSVLLRAESVGELLGETYEALRAAPIFETLGGGLVSADDLADAFPGAIDYLESAPLESVEEGDWHPLLASESVATLVARLLDREVREASAQHARRQIQRARQARMAVHRQQPEVTQQSFVDLCPVAIEFRSEFACGLVGIGPATGSLQTDLLLLVEGRRFSWTQTPSPLPMMAALEVDLTQVDQHFQSVSFVALLDINRELLLCAPPLLEAALTAKSTALVSNNMAVRSFLEHWLKAGDLPQAALERIRDLVSFFDQRGQLLGLSDASKEGTLQISTYLAEPWLEAEEGGAQDALDAPVVVIPEIAAEKLIPILSRLCGADSIRDVSDSVRKLQIARRIARGLLLAPTVPVEPAFKRSLTDLIASEMIGEIGFYTGSRTQVLICEQGEERVRVELDVSPPLIVAMEDGELVAAAKGDSLWAENARLQDRVQALSLELGRSVLATQDEIPEWLRVRLVRGMCSGSIEPAQMKGLASRALFGTSVGVWVSWLDLCDQAARFGDVWYVPVGRTREPLDSRRIAIALQPQEIPDSFTCAPTGSIPALPFLNAEYELTLDETARRNQSRPPVESLTLDAEQSAAAITSAPLEEEGLRGVVAPLFPERAGWRGVLGHREMHFIGSGSDPCSWPTLAIVDHAELSPDRTWSEPLDDEGWQRVSKAIRKASDVALVKAMQPPDGAVTSHWAGRYIEKREPAYLKKGFSVRGRLWITVDSDAGVINVRQSSGEVQCHPRSARRGRRLPVPLPVHGELLFYGGGMDFRFDEVREAVQEVVDLVYPRLLSQLARLKRVSEDTRAAHLAIGLATGHTDLETAASAKFSCFAPRPLMASEIVELTAGDNPVAMIDKAAMVTTPQTSVFVRDESELSRALLRLLEGRLFDIEAPSFDTLDIEIELDDQVPPPSRPSGRAAHVLDRLAEELHRRLALLDLHTVFDSVGIAPQRRTPILAFERGRLVLSGDNEDLRALETSRVSGNPTYDSCLDLVVAHALTLLNQGLTNVTDAAERRALVTLMRLER